MTRQIARSFRGSIICLALCYTASGQTYTIETIAGGGIPDNIPGTAASLSRVTWVATDTAGNVFLTLPDHHVVLRLDAATGVLARVAGNGAVGSSGDNGPAASAQLLNPGALAIDPQGNLFIVDNNSVRMVHSGYISTAVGGLNGPSGLAVDSAGNLYIAEAGANDVLELSGGSIGRIVGTGASGYNGDNLAATAAQLNNPQGIALDSAGRLYIADTNNGRVRKVENGMITTQTAVLTRPKGVAVDTVGNLYIASDTTGRVFQMNGLIMTAAGTGALGFNGDGGPAPSAWLYSPQGVAVDSSGNLYIADTNNFRVRKVARGIITTVAGGGTETGDNGPATSAWLYRPTGVALDAAGSLYVADSDNYRVRRISNGIIGTVAGSGAPGCGGDGGPATAAQLRLSPLFDVPGEFQGISVDTSGNLVVADSTCNRVRAISSGTISSLAGGAGQLSGPEGVAVDAAGAVYIADQGRNRIRKIANGVTTTVADGVAAPSGIALDGSGGIYFVEQGNHRVRRMSNGVVTTVAGGGAGCDNCPATEAYLNGAAGIALDAFGSLYVAETESHVIRKVSGGVIGTVAGTANPGYGGDGGPALKAQLFYPEGLAVDSVGHVYVADTANNRVRVLTPSGAGCVYEVSPSALSISASGGSLAATIETADGCAWAVQGLPGWMTLAGNAMGSGAAAVSLSADNNPGPPRVASLSIAGLTVAVTQEGTLSINPNGFVNAASYANGAPVALGSIAAAFGTYLLDPPASSQGLPLSTSLAGLSLDFGNGVSAPLFYASGGQVNFQVPWELAGLLQTTVTAKLNGGKSASQLLNLALYAPGIFTMNSQGTGQGAILNSTYRLVDVSNPAARGASVVQIFCTGLGPVTNQPLSGSPAPLDSYATTTIMPVVTIGGALAPVRFSGLAPGYVGLYQVNALVPSDSATGDNVPVVITIGGAPSNTVTISVR
jgi:uncharacterized protein (TIGR03437 family)